MIELHVVKNEQPMSHRFVVPGEAAAWIMEEHIKEFEGEATESGEIPLLMDDLHEMGWGL